MTATETTPDPPRKRGLMLPLLAGLVLAALGGGGAFWAVNTDRIPFLSRGDSDAALADDPDQSGEGGTPAVAMFDSRDSTFLPLEMVVIALGPEIGGQHLIFEAQLEVASEHAGEVERLTPRVLDVLNSYLRVISLQELTEPTSLARLRAQMLRRIQVVTGAGRVRDLLITQFVVN